MTLQTRIPRIPTALLATAALMLAIALAGCGGSDGGSKTYNSQPLGTQKKVTVVTNKSFNADQQAAIKTVVLFGDLTGARDYAKICKDVFSAAASSQLGEGNCAKFLAASGKKFKSFKIKVTGVTIGKDGNTATVDTVTTTDGVAKQLKYPLKKENGQWRVVILGQ